MRQVLMKIEYLKSSSLYIGKVAENKATEVWFDITYWLNKYPDITFEAVYERPDGLQYKVETTLEDNNLKWLILRQDLYKVGTGYITLNGIKDDQTVVSATGFCFISPGANGIQQDTEGDPCDPSELIKQIKELKAKVDELAEGSFDFDIIYGGNAYGK